MYTVYTEAEKLLNAWVGEETINLSKLDLYKCYVHCKWSRMSWYWKCFKTLGITHTLLYAAVMLHTNVKLWRNLRIKVCGSSNEVHMLDMCTILVLFYNRSDAWFNVFSSSWYMYLEGLRNKPITKFICKLPSAN